MRRIFIVACLLSAGCSGRAREARITEVPELPAVGMVAKALAPRPYAIIETSRGEIVVRLFPEEAPKAVDMFVSLGSGKRTWRDPRTQLETKKPLYNGLHFFRVIPGFMIQTGDPLNEGHGRVIEAFEDEIHPKRSFDKPGRMALANSGPDSNSSQFFITVGKTPWLNGKHTIFGEVVSGLDVARKIARTSRITQDPGSGRRIDRPKTPQVIKQIRFEDR